MNSLFSEQALSRLHDGLGQIAARLPTKQSWGEETVQQLLRYWQMVEQTNATLNLTRITGDEAVTHHFLDAAAVAPFLKTEEERNHSDTPTKIIDIGTGLGVPGVVLAILYPAHEFVLLDSLDKRIQFLLEVKKQLSLDNITPIHGRAEFLAHEPNYRERFDFCISRAVTALPGLIELSLPFVKIGGTMIAMKGPQVQSEAGEGQKGADALGGHMLELHSVQVPYLSETRYVAALKKITETDGRYPRKPKKVGAF